jgi:hypothetical protein
MRRDNICLRQAARTAAVYRHFGRGWRWQGRRRRRKGWLDWRRLAALDGIEPPGLAINGAHRKP